MKAKNDAIDANNDLTAEEKAQAKEDAKAKADAAKQAIDNATTNDAVTQAKNAGVTSVDSVTPTPTAKPAAKQVIDDALKAKNDAIDANNDLTAEEKAQAKEDAKAKADAVKAAIDNATTNSEVDQSKSTGIEEVNSVNPIAQIRPAVGASAGVHVNSANPTSKEKPQEKQAIDQVLKTDEAKAKVKDSVAFPISQLENENQQVATNQRVVARELPNTGTTESITAMVAAAASAILGFGLIARRRKEDEEDKLENQ
ncbi:Gram positive anchor [Streptococcus mitis]|uniref:Gram positive anchor n=1 Tax=Streptococcus mitis TaxID=28037 RepID=A0A0F2DTG1_STRMT|nr:Gram positive anchor [Streptococcus mitis]